MRCRQRAAAENLDGPHLTHQTYLPHPPYLAYLTFFPFISTSVESG